MRPFNFSIEPVGSLIAGESNTMRIDYHLKPQFEDMGSDSGRYIVKLFNPRDFKKALSDTTYTVSYNYDYSSSYCYSYSGTFEITFPEAETTYLDILVHCGHVSQGDGWYVIPAGDTMQFLHAFIMPPLPEDQLRNAPLFNYLNRDTLTQENLQTEYKIIINLSDSLHMESAFDVLGYYPKSFTFERKRGDYIITTTAENILKFVDLGFDCKYYLPLRYNWWIERQ